MECKFGQICQELSCPCLSGQVDGRMKNITPSVEANVNVFEILQAITGESAAASHNEKSAKKNRDLPEENPAAVALGRLGGLAGGEARAVKLSAKKRTEVAKKVAKSRWGGGKMQ